jgi:nicotinamide mononucleotide adenylyltransferase
MFEMAKDFAKFSTDFEVIGGFLSPVSDSYKKAGLASARHRLRMCEIGTEATSRWLMVDPWEALQTGYTPTAKVLDHFDREINEVLGGAEFLNEETGEWERRPVRIALLAGADLIQTMGEPGVWSQADLDHILSRYGAFIVERTGTDIDQALVALAQWKDNIWVIQQLIQNDVSSTKIRLFLRKELSVRYLIPEDVVEYIEREGLYEDESAVDGKGKGKRSKEASVSPSRSTKGSETAGKALAKS